MALLLQKRAVSYNGLAPITVLCGFVLLSCVICSDEWISTIVSTVTLTLFLLGLLVFKPSFLVKYFAFVFVVAANVLGCFVVETFDVYLYEVSAQSEFSGSLPLLIFSRWLFLVCLVAFDWLFARNRSDGSEEIRYPEGTSRWVWLRWLNVIAAGLIIVSFIHVLPYPSFASGLDRFFYAEEVNGGVWGKISNNLGYLVVLPVLAFRFQKSRLGLVGMVLYLLFLFWTGHKFGGYFDFVYILLLVYFDKISLLKTATLVKCLFAIVLATGLLVGFAAFANSLVSSKDSAQFIADRAAQQGQLWWKTYDQLNGEYHPEEFYKEIEAISSAPADIKNNIGADYGIYKIMYYTSSDPTIIDGKLATGSRYSEAAYPLMLYYFGPLGACLFSAVSAALVCLLLNGFLLALRCGFVIDAIILYRFFALIRSVLGAFTLANLFTTFSLLMFAYLVLSVLLHVGAGQPAKERRRGYIQTFPIPSLVQVK